MERTVRGAGVSQVETGVSPAEVGITWGLRWKEHRGVGDLNKDSKAWRGRASVPRSHAGSARALRTMPRAQVLILKAMGTIQEF